MYGGIGAAMSNWRGIYGGIRAAISNWRGIYGGIGTAMSNGRCRNFLIEGGAMQILNSGRVAITLSKFGLQSKNRVSRD